MSAFLVTQATGEQGRWVITHLLASGAKVHAVVRDLQKVPELLKSPGVTLFQGESKDFDSILKAAQGCKGAFLNTFPIPGLEALQAKNIVQACEEAGIESIVATTTYLTGNKDVWNDDISEQCLLRDYYTSKAEVESIVRGANVQSYTILRPSVLHQDFYLPGAYGNYPKLPQGELDHAFDEGVKTPFTDANDVGRYAAAALLDPAKFKGQEIELANESLTIEEAHELLVKTSGRNVRLRKRSEEETEGAKAAVFGQRFQLWSNKKEFGETESAAKQVAAKYGIPLTSLKDALKRDEARLLECLPADQ